MATTGRANGSSPGIGTLRNSEVDGGRQRRRSPQLAERGYEGAAATTIRRPKLSPCSSTTRLIRAPS